MYLDPVAADVRLLWEYEEGKGLLTLVSDLEDGPQNLVLLLPLVRRILGIFHFIAEF
jgi:hypothetical protein